MRIKVVKILLVSLDGKRLNSVVFSGSLEEHAPDQVCLACLTSFGG